MAEFTIPPAFEPLVEACGEAALPAFQGADFANDPGAAFQKVCLQQWTSWLTLECQHP